MTYILIDASHLFYRSANVFKDFCNSKRYPTGVQFGVLRAFESIRKKYPTAKICLVRDGYSTDRRDLLASYKASRGECKSPEVYDKDVVADVLDMVRSLGLSEIYDSTLECDDTIANTVLSIPNDDVIIYSGDQDFHQLADENSGRTVKIWMPGKKGEDRVVGLMEVFSEWGVSPLSLPLFRSFEGDTSDEIPGLPRLPKELLRRSCQGITRPEEFYGEPPLYDGFGMQFFNAEWRRRLIDFKPQCEINFRVTKLPFHYRTPIIHTDVFNRVAFTSLCERLEFKSYLKKLDLIESLFGAPNEQVLTQPN